MGKNRNDLRGKPRSRLRFAAAIRSGGTIWTIERRVRDAKRDEYRAHYEIWSILKGFDFDERRRIIRRMCEDFAIDPQRITPGS